MTQPRHILLRVGLDMDHTLMFNDLVWRRIFREHTCIAPVPHRHVPANEVSAEWDHFRHICEPCFVRCITEPDLLLAHDPLPGALETVTDLYARGVEFHVVSTRPQETYDATVGWLRKNGFLPYISSVNLAEKKRPVCERLGLDVLVDDSPYVHHDMHHPSPSSTRVLFKDTSHNQNYEVARRFVHWSEIHEELLTMLAARGDLSA